MTDSTRKTGDQAELIAINYLQRNEYEIIDTNFVASKGGEIDVIAKKDGITVFFEVKYRATESHGSAIETFTRTKKHRFFFAVKWYCMKHKLSAEYIRVDFIAIQRMRESHRLSHFKNIEME